MKDKLIALDFGAATTKICVTELGYILNEPSFVYESENQILFGKEAKQKESEYMQTTQLFKNGTVLNFDAFAKFYKSMLAKCNLSGAIRNVFVSIPNGIDVSVLNDIENCLVKCGAIKVIFVNQALLAYKGLNEKNTYKIIVDIGASKTDISIVNNDSVFTGINLSVGCNDIDNKIKEYCYNTFSIDITNDMAEKIRTNVGSLNNNYNIAFNFYGLSINGNKFAKNTIHSIDIYSILEWVYSDICTAIETMLNVSDVNILSEIAENGIEIIGGGALINGLESFFQSRLKLKCNIAKNACDVIALGLEKLV